MTPKRGVLQIFIAQTCVNKMNGAVRQVLQGRRLGFLNM